MPDNLFFMDKSNGDAGEFKALVTACDQAPSRVIARQAVAC